MRDEHEIDLGPGPVVRPYALTGGRTRPTGETIDLLATVTAISSGPVDDMLLDPEYVAVMRRCWQPTPVADLASDLNLALGVIRILLSGMRDQGLVTIRPPARSRLADPRILRDVADALRRL